MCSTLLRTALLGGQFGLETPRLGLHSGQFLPVHGELFQGELLLQRKILGSRRPQFRRQLLQLFPSRADILLLLADGFIQLAQTQPLLVQLGIDHLVQIGIDHLAHEQGGLFRVLPSHAHLHEFRLARETYRDVFLQPNHRIAFFLLAFDHRELRHEWISQGSQEDKPASHQLRLRALVNFKTIFVGARLHLKGDRLFLHRHAQKGRRRIFGSYSEPNGGAGDRRAEQPDARRHQPVPPNGMHIHHQVRLGRCGRLHQGRGVAPVAVATFYRTDRE